MGNSTSLELKNTRRRLEFDWLNKVAEAHMSLKTPEKVKVDRQQEEGTIVEFEVEEGGEGGGGDDDKPEIHTGQESMQRSNSFDEIFGVSSEEEGEVEEEAQCVREQLEAFVQTNKEEEEEEVGHTYSTSVPSNMYVSLQVGADVRSRRRMRAKKKTDGPCSKNHQPYDYSAYQPLK